MSPKMFFKLFLKLDTKTIGMMIETKNNLVLTPYGPGGVLHIDGLFWDHFWHE